MHKKRRIFIHEQTINWEFVCFWKRFEIWRKSFNWKASPHNSEQFSIAIHQGRFFLIHGIWQALLVEWNDYSYFQYWVMHWFVKFLGMRKAHWIEKMAAWHTPEVPFCIGFRCSEYWSHLRICSLSGKWNLRGKPTILSFDVPFSYSS